MKITPLDNWIYEKTGAADAVALRAYQLEKFRETLAYVKQNSRFYGKRLANIEPGQIHSFEDISSIPFTTAEMLAGEPLGFVCVPPGEIGRIVTLPTSGTAGPPKRLFFTPEDQELTIDFFHRGMSTFTSKDDRVLIFLPGETANGVGDLLKHGLARTGCEAVAHGPVIDYEEASRALESIGATCVVGLPAQMLALSRLCPGIKLKSALLCSDYISRPVRIALESAWGCEVFGHYGMTESGLGGAVECSAHTGYHIREADLLIEIVDPASGAPLTDGERGEVVFTTLTRRGMPLIRYKTGDLSCIIPGPCPCSSRLRRLGVVSGRIRDTVRSGGIMLTMPMLDELLFAEPRLAGFSAEITNESGVDTLAIAVFTAGGGQVIDEAERRIMGDPQLGTAIKDGLFRLELRQGGPETLTYGNTKRQITDTRRL